MVGVDADGVDLQVEGKVAALGSSKLVLVEVGPAPDPSVDDVRKALTTGNLLD